MVHHRRRRAPALHPVRPHLGRSRPGPDGVPVPSRTSQAGSSRANPGHGSGGAWRPLRADFDGLEVEDDNVLMGVGDGLKATQIRLGPARLTHCMRWLGLAKRCLELARPYVESREAFGAKLVDRESVQMKLGRVASAIEIGRLLVMKAAWALDQGSRAGKEISMAKVQVADTLQLAADSAIQLCGAYGYSKDSVSGLDLPLRPAGTPRRRGQRSARDGDFRAWREQGLDFWCTLVRPAEPRPPYGMRRHTGPVQVSPALQTSPTRAPWDGRRACRR